jgi:AcrR family transcriptional regulator
MPRQDPRLDIARHAAILFFEHGVAATSGKDIAVAAGVSERTVWRHFRTKESCVEPLFVKEALRFVDQLRTWSRHISIEDHLTECFAVDTYAPEDIRDGVLIVRLLAIMPDEPDLRATWLMACHQGEEALMTIIAGRLDRPAGDPDVRLCAATVGAALRIVDETISSAAVTDKQAFTMPEIVSRVAAAVRVASTLPFCDPVPRR